MVTRALSIEDGNLNRATIITARSVDYSDIDLTFEAKGSGDIFKKTDGAAVRQAVKNLLLTNPGEKPFRPNYGAGLNNLFFELADIDAEIEIADAITLAVENFEPRAKVLNVRVNSQPDRNSIAVTVEFQVISTNEVIVLETTIARLR